MKPSFRAGLGLASRWSFWVLFVCAVGRVLGGGFRFSVALST